MSTPAGSAARGRGACICSVRIAMRSAGLCPLATAPKASVLPLTRRLDRAAGIVTFRLTLHVCGVDRETAWTVLNLSHAAFSFYYVHWLKGMPMFRCARHRPIIWQEGAARFQRYSLYRTVHWVTHGAAYYGLRCRGTPDYNEKYDRLTFWEQLDGGTQYTLNKKFLTIIPIVLFLFTISNCAQHCVLCCLAFGL